MFPRRKFYPRSKKMDGNYFDGVFQDSGDEESPLSFDSEGNPVKRANIFCKRDNTQTLQRVGEEIFVPYDKESTTGEVWRISGAKFYEFSPFSDNLCLKLERRLN